MDRQEQIEILLDHYNNPRHRHELGGAEVIMPGGNPGCGDIITVYLNTAEDGTLVADLSWVGEGCTISQASASILTEMIHDEHWSIQDILDTDYTTMIEILGKEAVQTRPKCATLALGTLKAAVRKYQRDRLRAEHGIEPLELTDDELAKLGLAFGDSAHQTSGKPFDH